METRIVASECAAARSSPLAIIRVISPFISSRFFSSASTSDSMSAQELFVQLGDLSRNHDPAIGAKNVDRVLHGFHQTVRCFVEDLRARRHTRRLQQGAACPGLGRKEPAEAERIGRQAAGNQRRNKCRRSGDRHHANVVSYCQRDQPITWVAHARHPASLTTATFSPFSRCTMSSGARSSSLCS